MKKYLLPALIFLLGHSVFSQQEANFTQYMFNQLPLNPAYTGIHEGLSASLLWREQWVGFEGAPSTQTLSLHTPIAFRSISLGGVIMRDKQGLSNSTNVRFMYAYRIRIRNSKISFGLETSLAHYRNNYIGTGTSDQTLLDADENIMKPNFGTGILWHGDKFYLGVGLPNAFKQQLHNSPQLNGELLRHYYFTGGYVFAIYDNFLVKPNFMVKAVQGAPVQADFNINMLLQRVLWVGLSYRSFESLDAVLQFQINPKFQVGYAFDFWTTTDVRRVSNGSHEIMINYVFELPKTKIITPRYF